MCWLLVSCAGCLCLDVVTRTRSFNSHDRENVTRAFLYFIRSQTKPARLDSWLTSPDITFLWRSEADNSGIYQEKLKIFSRNIEIARALNSEEDEDLHRYGITKFMDYSGTDLLAANSFCISSLSECNALKRSQPTSTSDTWRPASPTLLWKNLASLELLTLTWTTCPSLLIGGNWGRWPVSKTRYSFQRHPFNKTYFQAACFFCAEMFWSFAQ